jgi:hypothetical protein
MISSGNSRFSITAAGSSGPAGITEASKFAPLTTVNRVAIAFSSSSLRNSFAWRRLRATAGILRFRLDDGPHDSGQLVFLSPVQFAECAPGIYPPEILPEVRERPVCTSLR